MEEMQSLSYSSLHRFDECPERFRREYLTGARRQDTQDAKNIRGTIVHEFLDRLMQQKIDTGDWPTLEEAKISMADLWDKGWVPEGKAINILKSITWEPEFYEKSAEDSVFLVARFYRDILPTLNPTQSEATIHIPLPLPGKDIKSLMGKIDCVAEPNFVIDWKTSGSAKKWLDSDLQATVYAALLGYPATIVQFITFVFLKKGAPHIEPGFTRRDERHTNWLLYQKIPSVIRTLETGIFVPSPGYWCDTCPAKCGAFPDQEVFI